MKGKQPVSPRAFKWYHSIRIKIPLFLVLMLIIPVVIFWQYSNSNTMTNITDNTSLIIESGLSNLSLSVEHMTNEISSFARTETNDPTLIALIKDYLDAREDQKIIFRSQLTLYLQQRVLENELVDSAYIVIEDRDSIITTEQGAKELSVDTPSGRSIYDMYAQLRVNVIAWFTAHDNFDPNDGQLLSYIRPVQIKDKHYPNVSLICNKKIEDISDMVGSITLNDGRVIVSNYDGDIMFKSANDSTADLTDEEFIKVIKANMDKTVFSQMINGQEYLVVQHTSLQTSWNYAEMVPTHTLYGSAQSQMSLIYALVIFCVLGSVAGALVVTQYVIRPINRLNSGFIKLGSGDLIALPPARRNDELGFMLQGYNSMVSKLKSLINELYVKELLRKQAQLLSLQSQINEHFLYNVLNSIYCIAKKENAEQSADVIQILSRFFRQTLSKGHDFVTVRDVVSLIECYMFIQKTRYESRLEFDIIVDPELESKYVLKYLFQPIVENAVLHGIESKNGAGYIRISFCMQGDLLSFRVYDNGVGLTEEKIAELSETFEKETSIKGDNFALKNINAQIRMAYGEEYGLNIKSIYQKETEVSFDIPIRESSEQV